MVELLLAVACTGSSPPESPGDTQPGAPTPGDSAQVADSADSAEPGEPMLVPPEGFWQGRFFTIPAERGRSFELDEDFYLEGYTVPQLAVLADGSFVMLATRMDVPTGRWFLTSADALTWTAAEGPLMLPDDFEMDCGNRLEDGAFHVLSDGRYRVYLEGTQLDQEKDQTLWRAWCQAESDGDLDFEPLDTYAYMGSKEDGGMPSVPGTLLRSEWSLLVYYVGDLYGADEGSNGVRIATWEGGTRLTPWVTSNVLADGQIDPLPVYLEGGGLRLYHTSTQNDPETGDALGPGPGFADSPDGVTFGELARVLLPEGHCTRPDGGECFLDPTLVRLDDGRIVLYFTSLEGNAEDGITRRGIGRAFATD